MDVHRNLTGLTLEDVERAHMRDELAQDQHGVRYLRFFHNAEAGTVFCLAEGPSAEACRAVHLDADVSEADEIIEVEPIVVDGFLGGGGTTPRGLALTGDGDTDTALRTLMFTDIVDSTTLTRELGDVGGLRLVEMHDAIIREQLTVHRGREVKHTGDGILASFVSPRAGVACAVDIQRAVHEATQIPGSIPLRLRIGLHVGEPVAAHGDVYGQAVNLCRRLCDAGDPDEILISQVLHDLTIGKGFRIEARGAVELKGFPEAVAIHTVHWRTDGGS